LRAEQPPAIPCEIGFRIKFIPFKDSHYTELLRWEQSRDAFPALIRQLEIAPIQLPDGGRSERWCLLPGSSSHVTPLGNRLVPAAKGRPTEPEAKAFG
jgi:hypothetical protein